MSGEVRNDVACRARAQRGHAISVNAARSSQTVPAGWPCRSPVKYTNARVPRSSITCTVVLAPIFENSLARLSQPDQMLVSRFVLAQAEVGSIDAATSVGSAAAAGTGRPRAAEALT